MRGAAMLTNLHPVQKSLLMLAATLALSCAPYIAAAQSVPMLVQAETMTLVAPMAAGYDVAAMGGRFISPTSGTSTNSPVRSAHVQVSVPAAGTYYLWARIAGPTDTSDALYVGIDASFDRVFPSVPGPYQWVRVETSDGSAVHGFSLGAGDHTIQVGYGEIGAKLDAVYLTADAAEVPTFTPPMRLAIEAESFNRVAPMTVGAEATALGGQYLSPTSGTSTTNPVRSADVQVSVPAGTWYLWARIAGPTDTSDALYVGIGTSFDRVFPSALGAYQWVRVETANGSGINGFSLAAGAHTIQVGYGEIGAKLDAVYLTNDSAEVPSFAPMRRVIEAETMTLTAPMMVGVDANANGAQHISATSGTNSTVPVREASTTVTAPAAGTYYLWARLKGASMDSDALYVGFNNTWDRVFPSTTGSYEWVRVENGDGSAAYGFSLSAGEHIIQVGHGEIGARLDAVYVTDDANDTPTGQTSPPLGPCVNPSGGYEGFGRNTTGGAGQSVYRVTNLNNSGTGSLRDALSVGNRCIVFDGLTAGGTINLTSQLNVRSNVTIDGFTAPSPGITLRNDAPFDDTGWPPILNISGMNNVVVRGIRVRHSPADGITIYNAFNVVVDHVSVSGFGDGAIDVTRSSHDVTIQWSILGDGNPQHNFPSLISYNAHRVSVHHNLYVRGDYRNPMCSGPSAWPPDITCDVRNNLVWDFAGHGTSVQTYGMANIINNYYYSSGRLASDGRAGTASSVINLSYGPNSVYVSGNHSRNGWNLEGRGNRSTPFSVVAPATTDAITAAKAVREKAGARNLPTWGLDATDQGYINQIPEQL
jgi:pectate lyase